MSKKLAVIEKKNELKNMKTGNGQSKYSLYCINGPKLLTLLDQLLEVLLTKIFYWSIQAEALVTPGFISRDWKGRFKWLVHTRNENFCLQIIIFAPNADSNLGATQNEFNHNLLILVPCIKDIACTISKCKYDWVIILKVQFERRDIGHRLTIAIAK